MLDLTVIGLAALALLCAAFLLDHVARRRADDRDRSALHVALVLSRHDEGLRLLDVNSRRGGQWWTSTPATDLAEIDQALTSWDVVARYIAEHKVDQGVILDVFGWRIVETWEQAYTYIEDRRPELWDSLVALYADAWDVAHPDGAPAAAQDAPEPDREPEPHDPHAVTPEEVPEVDVLPAELLAPLPTAPVTAPAVGHHRLTEIRAALHHTHASAPVAVSPAAPRRGSVDSEIDAPADLVIDLLSPAPSVNGSRPRPVHR